MSAAKLREAAALMRSRAEAAPDGPWYVYETFTHRCVGTRGFPNLGRRSHPYRGKRQVGYATEAYPPFADHAASWHPAVALAVADWLDDIGERHKPDPEPMELTLHYDEECPTGECEDPGYHKGCVVCSGCYPTYDGMEGRCLYPCLETRAALAVASAYLGGAA